MYRRLNRHCWFIFLLILVACSPDDGEVPIASSEGTGGHWLVPFGDILYWGDPTDEIESIDQPEFIRVTEGDWQAEDRMLVQFHEGELRAYPVNILEVHEVVNDRRGDHYFVVSYCPITGSGMAWNRSIRGEVTEFGVSGMLYHDNLVLYDRNTGSYWSQMRSLCIHGEYIEVIPEAVLLFETDFGFLQAHFPDALLLADPGQQSASNRYSSAIYKDTSDDIEPGSSAGPLLDPGTYYFGVIHGNRALAFSLDEFAGGVQAYAISFYGKQWIVAGSQENNFVVAYESSNSLGRGITAVTGRFPIIMEDEKGNAFDLFGQVVSGPDTGSSLVPAHAYRAKGFAWQSIFNTLVLFEE